MRFKILLEEPVNNIAKAHNLTALIDNESLSSKRATALKTMTDLNIRNCQLSYLSQKVKDSNHPIFEIIYILGSEFPDNQQILQIYKNFSDVQDIKDIKHFNNIIKVLESLKKLKPDKIKKIEDILKDVELYKRNDKDFEYTFKLLSILTSTDSYLKKYFKDPNIVNFDDLMINNHLKPAGIDTLDQSNNTLFGTIRSWTAGQSGKASDTANEIDSNNVSDKDSAKNLRSMSTYSSFEEADDYIKEPKDGQVIHIDGEFKYDSNYDSKTSAGWKPIDS